MSDEDNIPIANGGPTNEAPELSKESLPTPPPSPLDDPDAGAKIHEKGKGLATSPEFFGGFAPKYPEYEVITPQTLQSITVRSMKVEDEEALKGSMVNRRKTPELINKTIWSVMVNHPYKDFDDFMNTCTIHDRDALLYGMYHVTYKDIQNYELNCLGCDKDYSVTIKLDDVFKMDAFHGEQNEILTQRFEVQLETSPTTIALIKQPTIADEAAMLSDMLFQSDKNIDLGIEMLIIDSFIDNKDGRAPMHIRERSDIFKAYQSMLPYDRKQINKTYVEQFGKYGVDLSMVSHCKHCGKENETRLDLLGQFFRALYE
jgi:hypothetical protein